MENGGAVFSHNSTDFCISNSYFIGNHADCRGGAVLSYRTKLKIKSSLFTNNSVSGKYGFGGAIYLGDTTNFVLSDSSIKGNKAMLEGGAIFNFQTIPNVRTSLYKNNIKSNKNGDNGAIFSFTPKEFSISNSTFVANQARYKGGAISSKGTKLNIQTSVFRNNIAYDENGRKYGYGGAIFSKASRSTEFCISNSYFIGNQALYVGGAICSLQTKLNIRTSLFENNNVPGNNGFGGGGAIFSQNSKEISIASTSFLANQAICEDGAIFIQRTNLSIKGSLFINNTVSGKFRCRYGHGGAIFSNASTTSAELFISNCSFIANQANSGGGAIYSIKGNLSVTTSLLENNSISDEYGQGGAISSYAAAIFFISNGSFIGNQVKNIGGAVFSLNSTKFSISSTYFTENQAKNQGGAIWSNGTKLSIKASVFKNNIAYGEYGKMYGHGGAVFSNTSRFEELSISNSSFMANQAMYVGGAICNIQTKLNIKASRFENNSVPGGGSYGSGGAIFSQKSKEFSISSTSFVANRV